LLFKIVTRFEAISDVPNAVACSACEAEANSGRTRTCSSGSAVGVVTSRGELEKALLQVWKAASSLHLGLFIGLPLTRHHSTRYGAWSNILWKLMRVAYPGRLQRGYQCPIAAQPL